MKFSFIRFFQELLNHSKSAATPRYHDELVRSIAAGCLEIGMLWDNVVVDSYKQGSMDNVEFFELAAKACPEFVSIKTLPMWYEEENQYMPEECIVLSKRALELLPKYIPELAR